MFPIVRALLAALGFALNAFDNALLASGVTRQISNLDARGMAVARELNGCLSTEILCRAGDEHDFARQARDIAGGLERILALIARPEEGDASRLQ